MKRSTTEAIESVAYVVTLTAIYILMAYAQVQWVMAEIR